MGETRPGTIRISGGPLPQDLRIEVFTGEAWTKLRGVQAVTYRATIDELKVTVEFGVGADWVQDLLVKTEGVTVTQSQPELRKALFDPTAGLPMRALADPRVPHGEIWVGPIRHVLEGEGAPRWEPALRVTSWVPDPGANFP